VAVETRPERLPRWRVSSNGFLCAVVILLSFLAFSYSLRWPFDHDEFAHVHNAWQVANGYTPYVDFFHNHHPLLWYSIAALLVILGNSMQTLVIVKLAIFGLAMGMAFLTFLIGRRCTSSTTASLFSVLLLLSMVMFVEKSIEIRPDVPQVLLGLASVYFLVSFIETHENKQMALAGLCASFAFLFSQKTTFLLIAYAALLLHGLLRHKVPARALLYFLIALAAPLLLFLVLLVASGSFAGYVLNNWLMNMSWLYTFTPLRYLGCSFVEQNALFWLLSPVAIGSILLSRKASNALRATAFIGIVLLFSILLVKAPFRQHFMFAIPLLCVATGYLLERVTVRFRLRKIHILILVIVLLSQPLLFLVPRSTSSKARDRQLARVQYVLDNSAASDLVYDGNIQFNLFRPDLHYFWFSVGKNRGLDTYNLVTGNQYGDYDGCQLVRSKRPRFISDYELDMTACGLRALYDETNYAGLYMLRELEGTEHTLWRDFGGVAALLGYGIEEAGAEGEHRLEISLWFQALAEMDRDYTVFIHVVDQDDRLWAQQDTLLLSADRPTSAWKAGETVKQQYDLALPNEAPAGVEIWVGLYYWETGERLPVSDEYGHRVIGDALLLAP